MALTKIGSIGINTGIQFAGVTTIATLNGSDSVLSVGGTVNFVSDVSIGGTVSIAGTLTYEDVTNVDAIGIITARSEIKVGSGITLSKDGDGFFTGVVTATSYRGDGSNLTGIDLSAVTGATADFSIADTIVHTGDTNTKIRFPAADTITAETGGSERLRIESSGRVLVNATTARNVGGGVSRLLQVEATDGSSGISVVRNQNSASPPSLDLGKSRSGSVGGTTIVQEGDKLGIIQFCGADGTDVQTSAAQIIGEVDGTPGSNDMPGRLVFKTTVDGSNSPTERLRLNSSGHLGLNVTPGSWDSTPTFVALEGGGTNKHGSLHFQANGDWTTSLGCNHYYNGGWKYRHNGGASWLAMKEDELVFRLASSGSADGAVSWTDYFKIDSSGHLLNSSDSARIKLGAGQDFNLYHNGTDAVISNSTGKLYIENHSSNASEVYIRAVSGENAITVEPNGAVHLYYNGGDSNLYTRYDGLTIRNNDTQGTKDCNIDLLARVDGDVQLHFYADNNTDNNKKFRIKADSDGESFKLESYYTGGWGYHLACTKGANNTSNRRFHAGDGGIRFDNTCHDYRDIDGDGHLFRRDGQAQLGVDDFFYIHDIDTNDTNNRIRHKFDSNAGSLAMEGGLSQNQSLDYAEFFEWSDGNPSNEDRIGHTVSIDGLTGKIKIAEEGETVIGAISGTAGVIGGAHEFNWQGRFKHDEWGREVFEELKDESGNLIYTDAETRSNYVKTNRIENSDWDSSLDNSYVPRALRKEWAIVGLLGQIRIRKNAVVPSNWVKLKEIDSVKDFYLVR